MKILRMFLWPIGAWPGEQLGDNYSLWLQVQKRTLPFQTFAVLLGELYFLKKNFSSLNFSDVLHVMITSFLSILTIVRTSLPNFKDYGIITKYFVETFHLMHYKRKGGQCLKVYTVVNHLSYYFVLYQSIMMVCGMTLFNISPLYNNYNSGVFSERRDENTTLDFAVYFAYPGFTQQDHFYFMTFLNIYCSYNCSVAVCSIDALLSLMVFQILGHLQILIHDLNNFQEAKSPILITEYSCSNLSSNVATRKQNEEMLNKSDHKHLIELINHHNLISRFTNNISQFYGPMLALNYTFHLVSGCMLLMECFQKDAGALIRFGPLTAIIFGQLIQLSVVFEIIGYMSEKIIDAVYCLPWQRMSVANQRIVCFWLQRVQKPVKVTASGVFPVGVQTMLAILKTTVSYFAFLQTLNK